MVLGSVEHARARGAVIHAILRGVGIAADAFHMTAPAADGAGQISAMRKALKDAELSAADIGHINAHATGTPLGDLAEVKAIRTVFGGAPVVTAPKASLGHLIGAGGAVEAIVTVNSLSQGVVPPTRNLHGGNVDPDVGLDIVLSLRNGAGEAAISNSFGFGGQNVCLLFTRS